MLKEEKIKSLLSSDINFKNAKNILQTFCIYDDYNLPIYNTIKIEGNDNNPTWETTICIRDKNLTIIVEKKAIAQHKLVLAEKKAAMKCINFFRKKLMINIVKNDNKMNDNVFKDNDNIKFAGYASAPELLYYPSPEELFPPKK
jgi:hypothetical protein